MSLPPLEPLDEPAGERLPGRAADRKDRRLDGLFAVVRGMLEQARDEELGVVSADRRWVQVVATGRMAERVQEPFLESVYARLANAARLYYARTGQEVLPIRRHDEAAATPFAPFMRLLLLLVEPGEGWRDQVSPDVAAELRRTRAQTTTHLVIMHVLDEYDELPCPEEDNGIGPATALAVRVGERAVLGLLDESDAALRALLIDLHASWDRKSRPGLPAGRPTKAGRLLEWLEQVDLQ